jgi:alkanesulfonate monooxygenase SsuD/methylene tetrahydromethanopterin reductase-like flavin-dependent oxidoreductase (luciferase family)
MPLENRHDALLHLALGAERRGYAAFAPPEAWAYDSTVLLAEVAARTERLRLATGILNVWSRSAGAIAMAAATLHQVSGGRFALGLGASTAQLTEGLHDVPFTAPVRQMRRVLTQVRALLKGDRVPLGVVSSGARPLKLNMPAAPELPILLAGLAEPTVRLAGELADGWLPFMFPRDRLAEGARLLAEGATRTGGTRPAPLIWPSMPTVVAPTEAEARQGAAWFAVFYLTSMGPLYPGTLARLGFEREVKAIQAANTQRGLAVVPPEADGLLEQLIVYGAPETARARLARWYEAGAALPTLLLPPNLTPAQMDFALDAFAG